MIATTIKGPEIINTIAFQSDLNQFEEEFVGAKEHYDPTVDLIIDEFVKLTKADKYIDRKDIKVRLITWPDFSYENSWAEEYGGFALGMYEGHVDVVLNKTYWESMPLINKKMMLWHELAHDLYDLEHTPDHDGFRYRLMYPADISDPDIYGAVRELRGLQNTEVRTSKNYKGLWEAANE